MLSDSTEKERATVKEEYGGQSTSAVDRLQHRDITHTHAPTHKVITRCDPGFIKSFSAGVAQLLVKASI